MKHSKKWPNKAPEPTPGLVTPRAMECDSEMKRRNEKRDAARGAPSPVVAHLFRWANNAMKRRITWFVLVTALTAGIQVGVQRLNEALILDYRVPQTVAQEVAGLILAQYVRDCSWEKAHYTYYIASDDHRIDVERLVRETPTLPNVVLYPYTKGVPLQSRQDLIEAKLKSIATVGGISGTWKRVHLTLVRYVSPLGITHIAFTVERSWFGWIVTSQDAHPIS